MERSAWIFCQLRPLFGTLRSVSILFNIIIIIIKIVVSISHAFSSPFAGTYKDGVSPKGYVLSDHMLLGSVVATILVIVVTVQIALDTSYWTIVNHIMVWGSVIWYFILDYFYNFIIGGSYVGSLTMVI